MSRIHALVLSSLLAAAAVFGSYATIRTVHIGAAATRPETATEQELRARTKRLDAWQASLRKALRSRPPALPSLPRYGAVQSAAAPAATGLPQVTRGTAPRTVSVADHGAPKAPAGRVDTLARRPVTTPVTTEAPRSGSSGDTPPPAATPPAAAPQQVPAAATAPPPTNPPASGPTPSPPSGGGDGAGGDGGGHGSDD